jgi:hypothetical protein
MQILQSIGDESGMLHRFTDGTGLGGTEIGGLDPLTLCGRNARRRRGWTFVAAVVPPVISALFAAIIPPVIAPFVTARLASLRHRFRCVFSGRFIRWFTGRFWFVMVFRRRGVGGEFGGRIRVRDAEAAGIIHLGFVMFNGLGRRRDFIRRRVFFRRGGVINGCFVSSGARPLATATATATAAATVITGTAGWRGRLQIRVFVWHKF